MTSILTNNSANTALQLLKTTNNNLAKTQERISSGLKVGTAADNAAYWSIATTMNSDKGAIDAANEAIGVGSAKVDVAYEGVDSAIKVLNEIKNKLTTASEGSTDNLQIQLEIGELQKQLGSIANGASFNGENWLTRTDKTGTAFTSGEVVDGFVRNGTSVSVTKATVDLTNIALFDAVSATGVGTGGLLGIVAAITLTAGDSQATIDGYLDSVEEAIGKLNTAGATLGSLQTRIGLQSDFATKLSDALESGVGRLVDADMEEESARLSALQTQQQLGIQALSIANSSTQNILSLFQ